MNTGIEFNRMLMTSLMHFQGSFPVLITPFNEHGAINEDGIRLNVGRMLQGGANGLVVPGGTGETAHLTESEFRQVLTIVVETVHKRVPVIASPIYPRPSVVITQAQNAEKIGVDGLLVLPPYYYAVGMDELVAYYKSVADAVSIPIMLYNNPQPINMELDPTDIVRLAAASPLIQYVKDSTIDIRRVQRIMSLSQQKIKVL
ncbi:dihydrodipicolinate synthase family protein, partial [bacterium]|nr:dihydrodipicolinate synthase family protein [bacterium]